MPLVDGSAPTLAWTRSFGGPMRENAAVDAALAAVPRWQDDLSAFVDALAARRRRRIAVLNLPGQATSATIYGAWLPAGGTDYIFVAEHLTGIHRHHVVLHEVAHMVLNHRPSHDTSALFDGVSPELAHRLLARHEHGDIQEQQAELFASRLMAASGRAGKWAHDPRGDRAAEVFG